MTIEQCRNPETIWQNLPGGREIQGNFKRPDITVEVPSAAVMADLMAPEVGFTGRPHAA